jgi:ABC-type lipopolysaccharide export system ATPase subunit
MWPRDMVGNTNFLEERMEFLIFATPIAFHSVDFSAKFSLNQLLKIKKDLVNIGTLFNKINPCELAKIIDKAYIIRVFINGGRCRTPYIGENFFQRNGRNTSRNRIRQLVNFCLLT